MPSSAQLTPSNRRLTNTHGVTRGNSEQERDARLRVAGRTRRPSHIFNSRFFEKVHPPFVEHSILYVQRERESTLKRKLISSILRARAIKMFESGDFNYASVQGWSKKVKRKFLS